MTPEQILYRLGFAALCKYVFESDDWRIWKEDDNWWVHYINTSDKVTGLRGTRFRCGTELRNAVDEFLLFCVNRGIKMRTGPARRAI